MITQQFETDRAKFLYDAWQAKETESRKDPKMRATFELAFWNLARRFGGIELEHRSDGSVFLLCSNGQQILLQEEKEEE